MRKPPLLLFTTLALLAGYVGISAFATLIQKGDSVLVVLGPIILVSCFFIIATLFRLYREC